MPTYGKAPEYQEGQDWVEYCEILGLYFDANEIEEADKRRSVLLTLCGAKTYSLIRDLVRPNRPTEKSYEEIINVVKSHLQPQPSEVTERFKFNLRSQNEGETVNQFVASLRRLSEHCNFGNFLDDAIRDRMVCGLSSRQIQERLLTEKLLTVAKAIEIASGMETAERNAIRFHEPGTPKSEVLGLVKRNREQNYGRQDCPCFRCGKTNHTSNDCFFSESKCFRCGETGHIMPMCPKRRERRMKFKEKVGKRSNVYSVQSEEESDADNESNYGKMNMLKVDDSNKDDGIKMKLKLNGVDATMTLDTGACVSVISWKLYLKRFKDIPMREATIMLKAYNGQPLKIEGVIEVVVEYQNQRVKLPLYVLRVKGPALFGRNWLRHIKLNWHTISLLQNKEIDDKMKLKTLLESTSIFDEVLGKVTHVKAHLKMKPGAEPKFMKPRKVPYAMKEKIEKELKRLESQGILEKVEFSDWASPIVPVVKPNGDIRICGDFKVTINPQLDIPEHPLPIPNDLLAMLNGGKTFSKLDLSQAYTQVELDEESKDFVVINTHLGLFRYNRLPYGVSSAPAIFQSIMDKILQGLNVPCLLDDILIATESPSENVDLLTRVIQRLDKHGLKARKSKCFFLKESVEYLGHIIDEAGIRPSQTNVRSVLEAKPPENISELRCFMGLVNVHRKFIPNLSTISNPLNALLRKDSKWNWSKECGESFEKIKCILASDRVLVHYDPKKSLVLAVDASPFGLGAVISHVEGDLERPIAYASRTLSSAEKKYSQIEKEALAIMFGLQKFHQYLFGRKFILYTDHRPLTMILGSKTGIPAVAVSRLQRWAIKLACYNYDLIYKAGKQNQCADWLSRSSNIIDTQVDPVTAEAVAINSIQLESLPITATQIGHETSKDPLLARVLRFVMYGWSDNVPIELKPFFHRRHQLTTEQDCILWGIRVVIPSRYQSSILKLLHENHHGMVKMKMLARMHVWWPNLDENIEQIVRDCSNCQEAEVRRPETVNPWRWPSKPWQRLHVDFAGPFFGCYFLIMVDARTRWPEVHKMTSITASKTIAVFRKVFAIHGLCEVIVSDNGPPFTSTEFANFLKSNGIKHIRTPPYSPKSNGSAEKFVRTFKDFMRKEKNNPGDIEKKTSQFLFGYRTAPHTKTKITPARAMFGRELNTLLKLTHPDLENSMASKHPSATGRQQIRELSVGDPVMVRDYRENKRWRKGVIVRKLGPVTYTVQVGDLIWKRHIDQLKDLSGSTFCDAEEVWTYQPPSYPFPEKIVNTELTPMIAPAETAESAQYSEEKAEGGESSKPQEISRSPSSEPSNEPPNERRYPVRDRKRTRRLIEET